MVKFETAVRAEVDPLATIPTGIPAAKTAIRGLTGRLSLPFSLVGKILLVFRIRGNRAPDIPTIFAEYPKLVLAVI